MARFRSKVRHTSRFAAGSIAALIVIGIVAPPARADTAGPPTLVQLGEFQSSTTNASLLGQLDIHTDTSAALTLKWGPTTAYGKTLTKTSTASLTPAGWYSAAIAFLLTPVASGTIYHYQITATTAHGTYVSGDKNFITSAPPTLFNIQAVSLAGGAETVSAAAGLFTAKSATISVKYGPTTAYGFAGPTQTKTGSAGNPGYYTSVSFKLANLSPGATYHYQFTVTTAAGTTTSPDRTFATPTITWTPMPASPMLYPDDLSCTSATFCVELSGSFYTIFNGTVWSPPSLINAGLYGFRSLSCASASFCAAIGSTSNASTPSGFGAVFVATYNGTTWSVATTLEPEGYAAAIACPSPTLCLTGVSDLSTNTSKIYKFDGARWSVPVSWPTNIPIYNISCASTTFCVTVAGDESYLFNGTSWTALSFPLIADWPAGEIECRSSSFCMATGYPSPLSATFDGHAWSLVPAPGITDISAFGCSTATFCFGVGVEAGPYIYDGTTWTAADLPIWPDASACPASGTCFSFTTQGDASIGRW